VKEWLTAAEIASLPRAEITTPQGVNRAAMRAGWLRRRGSGSAQAWEYHITSLPASIAARYLARSSSPAPALAIAPASAPSSLRDHQRKRMEARLALLQHLDHIAETAGVNEAVRTMVELAAKSELPAHLQALVPVANARAGDSGERTLSARTLLRWRAERKNGNAALATRDGREAPPPGWGDALMTALARPQKPALSDALREIAATLPAGAEMPSYGQARRFLAKMSVIERNRGRMGPRALKQLRAFRRRDLAGIEPLDLVLMDGHQFDAEVAHPRHGRPFRPEVTAVIDAATRKIIGWSVALAESQHAVMDALRHAATTHGVPSILYVDRGSGYEGEIISAPVIGLLARMGTRHETSLPYNSQARGLIERAHQTLWVRAAKQLPTYLGADMDPEAGKKVHKLTRAAIKARSTSPLLMPWMQFLIFADEQVKAYNARPHRRLPKIDGRHLSPDEAYACWLEQGGSPAQLTPSEADDLFRPTIEVTTARGEVRVFSNVYFHRDLEHRTGERVMVAYDIHDAAKVWVKDLDGRLLCVATLDGNKTPFLPAKTVAEAKAERRHQERRRKLLVHLGEVDAELGTPTIEIEARELDPELRALAQEKLAELAPPLAANDRTPGERPVFADDVEFGKWCLAHPAEMTASDRTYFNELIRSWSFRRLIGVSEEEMST
jgi:putative transposase